jgi:hypothetical protein
MTLEKMLQVLKMRGGVRHFGALTGTHEHNFTWEITGVGRKFRKSGLTTGTMKFHRPAVCDQMAALVLDLAPRQAVEALILREQVEAQRIARWVGFRQIKRRA